MLLLSGIQHFRFCPRQWALIHIEQQWDENHLTIQGQFLHRHADDPSYRQKQGEIISIRAVPLASSALGLNGIADIVELHPAPSANNAITHPNYPGFWFPVPVEYKHGRPKHDYIDEVQLAAQAICLEEQYHITIPRGFIYYGATQHRQTVEFTPDLRQAVAETANQMHQAFNQGSTPAPSPGPHCRKCSIIDICAPYLFNCPSPSYYLAKNLLQ